MTIYCCEHEWEAMLTCIYDAWSSGRGQKNIKLALEPIEQYTLFDEYIHVVSDSAKANKLIDAICSKISQGFYSRLAYCSMSCEKDVLDVIFRVLLLGFAYGPQCIDMMQYAAVMRFNEIYKRYGNEAHSFREFIRFHEIGGHVYTAHIEPKSRVVIPLGYDFADRMPSENFLIVDDIHMEAVVHPKDSECYVRRLNADELEALKQTEAVNDEYTDLWQVFFDSIAIKQRINPKCQMNLFPKWKRKHAVEFV